MNLNDYLDGSDPSAYGREAYDTEARAYVAPSVHAKETGPVVTGNAQVSTLRLEAAPVSAPRPVGSVLGDFSTDQRCLVVPLVRLAWAFFATTAEGRTSYALGILSVYRALYNSQRAAIAPGFNAAARDALPVSLPEIAWTDGVRLSMQIVISGATGGRADRNAALASMPASVAELGAWFMRSRGLWDESTMRAYVEVPRVGGETLASSVSAAVQDDIERCLAPASAPSATVGPATGIAPCPPGTVRSGGRCVAPIVTPGPPSGSGGGSGGSGGGGGGGTAPGSRSGQGLLVVLVAALAAGVWWVNREDQRAALAAAEAEPCPRKMKEK
jgi:hypothetical protein